MKLYQEIAAIVQARLNCIQNKNETWISKHEDRLNELTAMLPHGSGIDGENTINLEKSTGEKVVIETSYHHMNDVGMYDGWTEHEMIIIPSLQSGFNIRVSGQNKNDIKSYLSEIFSEVLNSEVST